uniref:glutathione transferase n=1 Tax=Favella ehrenbergii TaxID=182087 RepID=A0A7S3MRH6_9SPIT
MVYLNIDFEEHQYEQGDAPDFNREQWLQTKDTLGLKFPNLPYLLDGSLKLTETNAIMKYIAHRYGPELLGGDAATIAKVEMVASVVGDLKGQVTMPCYTSGDRPAITANLLQKVKPIVNFLGEKKFLVGSDVTYVDFTLFEMCDLMNWISEGQLFEQNPSLERYYQRVKSLPRLSEYYADDERCMKRPFNNKVAKLNN